MGQFGLPDPGTLMMRNLVHLHDLALCGGLLVVWIVSAGLVGVVVEGFRCRNIYNAHWLELAWTGAPGVLLLVLGVPSIRLLYKIDEMVDPEVTVKAIGHQ